MWPVLSSVLYNVLYFAIMGHMSPARTTFSDPMSEEVSRRLLEIPLPSSLTQEGKCGPCDPCGHQALEATSLQLSCQEADLLRMSLGVRNPARV